MITIAWDIDDVLNDLMRCWFWEKWLPDHQECKKSYEDLKENPPHRILGVSLNEYLQSLDEFRLSEQYMKMKPVRDIMEWFLSQGRNFRHIALTAVPLRASSISAQWVIKNFGKWIRTFHFVPSKRSLEDIPEYDKDKGDFLKWFGRVDILIDDNPENIKNVSISGIKGLLIPKPWNTETHSTLEVLNTLK
ncbi:MAG: hypothetical protein A2Y97_11310 [Nitrospirae bacterium RBG_13_39_12]|nr:MAG: hypothetical protein A2Y97_11310 [Nitrospirae bacterium RBG_13_39_12]